MPRLEHVGIAVNDVARVLEILADLLGETAYQAETLRPDDIRTHFVWGGSAKLELLEGLGDRSAVRTFLDRRGPGLHHLAFEVDDVRAMHDQARKAGYDPIEHAPREGADGKLIFFLHPRQTAGVLMEFCQSARPALRPTRMPDVEGLRALSVARGSDTRPPCIYVFAGAAAVPPGDLAARLGPRRAFYAADSASSLRIADLIDAVDWDHVHLAADAPLTRAAIEADRGGRLRSLTLIDPDASDVDRIGDIRTDLLVITRADEHGMRQASTIPSLQPAARLAATTDSELRSSIIASHLERSRP